MSDRIDLEAAQAQMGFELVDSGPIEVPCSTPATFAFTEPAEHTTEAFFEAMDEHDFAVIDTFHSESEDGFYYKADVLTDHYKKCTVKVWEDRANIYPQEEGFDTYEVSRIIHGIEDAFGSELEHEP